MEIARAAEVGGVYQGKNQLLRGRNIWVKIAVLRNSRREAGCAQRNTRFWGRNIFRRRPKKCCAPFLRRRQKKKWGPFLLIRRRRLQKKRLFMYMLRV